MRHLGRGVNDELPGPIVPERKDTLAFQRMHGLACARDVEVDDDRCRCCDRIDATVERRFEKEIVAPTVVQLHRVGLAPAVAGDDSRQFVIVDLDEFRQILSRRAIFAHAHGDGLADESYLFPG